MKSRCINIIQQSYSSRWMKYADLIFQQVVFFVFASCFQQIGSWILWTMRTSLHGSCLLKQLENVPSRNIMPFPPSQMTWFLGTLMKNASSKGRCMSSRTRFAICLESLWFASHLCDFLGEVWFQLHSFWVCFIAGSLWYGNRWWTAMWYLTLVFISLGNRQ